MSLQDPPNGEIARAQANLAVLERLAELTDPAELTDDDRELLGLWSGWGPMSKAFETRDGTWGDIANQVPELVDDAGRETASASLLTAFFTTTQVIDAAWTIAEGIGFAGGRALEPGCGSGRFMAGAPEGMPIRWTGVEFDLTSARIAELLNPDATIIARRLEDLTLTDRSYDLVIGNVPFADVKPSDRVHPEHGLSLHNYFLWRSLLAVRPGGYVIAVTSRFTLDAEQGKQRGILSQLGDLVGAIRLPAGTFKACGTDVVADLVVLRRRHADEQFGSLSWQHTQSVRTDRRPVVINSYFAENPNMVLGELSTRNGQYNRDDLTVRATDAFEDDLDTAIGRIVVEARRFRRMDKPVDMSMDPGDFQPEANGRKESSFHVTGPKKISQVQLGKMVEVRYSAELEALIRLRDACLNVLEGEADFDRPDNHIEFDRMVLNDLYDAYVNNPSWGPVNRCTIIDRGPDPDTGMPRLQRRRPNMGGFRQDPDYVTVLSFEDYDDDTQLARKGPIFFQRINKRPEVIDHVDNIADAVAVSLDRHGFISLATIAQLMDLPAERIPERLSDLAFEDPALLNGAQSAWVPNDEYLAGNVREKLALARQAVRDDPARFHRNVAELTKIIPEDLRPEEIAVRLGAPWIPVDDVRDFIVETVLQGSDAAESVQVLHNKVAATWDVDVSAWARQSTNATVTWGTSRVDAFELIELACNGKAPEVYDPVPGTKKRVKNVDETLLATDKMTELTERFGEWIWEDPDRAQRLCRYYNDHFNSTVLRRYDGSHLTFPGMREGFNPYQSQKDMTYRSICLPASGCGHIVGAGKTSIMAMTAMKMKDLGLVRKPMAVVPNHLLEQVAREIKALFPLRRILMVTKDDLTKERRKRFAAKVATGNWDLVVMTHTGFGAMPVSAEVEEAYLRHDLERWEQSLRDVGGEGRSRSSKQLAKRVEQRRARLNDLLDGKRDDGVGFEVLGVDYLLVDEAHYFKNLATPGSNGITNPSKRAENLHIKLWWLRNIAAGTRVGTLYSGTLISNSLAEMFVVETYLQPDRLRAEGIDMVDAWAGLHIQHETKIEVAPDGQSFRMHRRPSRFSNVPELRLRFAEAVDVRTKGDLALPGPNVVSENLVVPPSPELQLYVDWLVQRADSTRSKNGAIDPPAPDNDNMLLICTDGRKAALDLELVGVRSKDPGKVGVVVENVAAVWRDHRDTVYPEVGSTTLSKLPGALQIVFCDLGTPNKDRGSQVYGKIKDGLAAAGMDPERIRFIHEANSDTAKTQLFNDCRNGKVDVLLGSTDKLGVGTNIQHRCVAIHHVDAPWRPSDVEQRVGRGDRPGNQNETLYVFRYIREGSFDSYMWQALERKAQFIAQVLTGDLSAREIPDIGDITLSYTEVKALATGNPLLLEAAEAQAEAARLRRHLRAHLRDQRSVENTIAWNIARAEGLEADGQARINLAERIGADAGYRPRLHGEVVHQHSEVGEALGTVIDQAMDRCERPGTLSMRVGQWGNVTMQVNVRNNWMKWELSLDAMGADGDWVSLCDVSPLWLKAGQWYRLGDAVAGAFGGLATDGDQKLMEALKLRTRADDSRSALKAFPQADELAAAEARVNRIEEAINAEVNRSEREHSAHAAEVYTAEAAGAES